MLEGTDEEGQGDTGGEVSQQVESQPGRKLFIVPRAFVTRRSSGTSTSAAALIAREAKGFTEEIDELVKPFSTLSAEAGTLAWRSTCSSRVRIYGLHSVVVRVRKAAAGEH